MARMGILTITACFQQLISTVDSPVPYLRDMDVHSGDLPPLFTRGYIVQTDWFARPVLHVTDVETSLHFYIDRLGFTSPWRYEEDGRARVAQVDRQGCALILADTWPDKIGKGLMFISLNVEPVTQVTALDAL